MQIVQEINDSITSPRERKDVVKATLDSVKKAKELIKANVAVQCDVGVEASQKEMDEMQQLVRRQSNGEAGEEGMCEVKKAQAERDDASWEIERLVQDKVCDSPMSGLQF
eukprot:766806-Hanusia_phi.AAC.4